MNKKVVLSKVESNQELSKAINDLADAFTTPRNIVVNDLVRFCGVCHFDIKALKQEHETGAVKWRKTKNDNDKQLVRINEFTNLYYDTIQAIVNDFIVKIKPSQLDIGVLTENNINDFIESYATLKVKGSQAQRDAFVKQVGYGLFQFLEKRLKGDIDKKVNEMKTTAHNNKFIFKVD